MRLRIVPSCAEKSQDRLLVKAFGVDLDDVPVGIADIDLRVPGGRMGLHDHSVGIVRIGVLPVALRAEELHGRMIIRHADREMNIAGIERIFTKRRRVVNDQMEFLGIAESKPGAREIEGWPWNLVEREDFAVEVPGPVEVGDCERNVVKGRDLHAANRHSTTKTRNTCHPPSMLGEIS